MSPNCYVSANMIDVWSTLLNKEEELRSKSSEHRFFFGTAVLVILLLFISNMLALYNLTQYITQLLFCLFNQPETLRNNVYTAKERLKMFKSNISEALEQNAAAADLKGIDLV